MKKLSLIILAIIGLTSQFTLADSLEGEFPPYNTAQPYTGDDKHPDDLGINRELMKLKQALTHETNPEAQCVMLSNTSVARSKYGDANIRVSISYYDASMNFLKIKHIKESFSGANFAKLSAEFPIPFGLLSLPEEIIHTFISMGTATVLARIYLAKVLNGEIKFEIPLCSVN